MLLISNRLISFLLPRILTNGVVVAGGVVGSVIDLGVVVVCGLGVGHWSHITGHFSFTLSSAQLSLFFEQNLPAASSQT